MEEIKPQGKLGPHEGIEYDLMLVGKKDIAYFCCELSHPGIDERFSQNPEKDGIFRLEAEHDIPMDMNIFYRQDKKDKALCFLRILEASVLLYHTEPKCRRNLEVITGLLLGYTLADVEVFIEHSKFCEGYEDLPSGIEGKLNPHKGIEYNLMRIAQKDVAYFSADELDTRFLLLKDDEEIYKLERKSTVLEEDIHIFYRSNKKDKATALFLLLEAFIYNRENICRAEFEMLIGRLLGYSREDVEVYLQSQNIA
ncbi:MAG: hypothetical protein J6M05_04305 [Cardiobacteriaceae bacterium]|nr:hypothetical protein [Cardiobacteriaceae bacterium]